MKRTMKISKLRSRNGQRIYISSDEYQRERFLRNHWIRASRISSKVNLNRKSCNETREAVRTLIKDLEKCYPAGLAHVGSVSRAIGRPLKIHLPDDNVNLMIGKKSNKSPVLMEYKEGHWTLNDRVDPEISSEKRINDCMFEVVAAQVGLTPADVRNKTIREMKMTEAQIAKEMDNITFINGWKDALRVMLGGAKYTGESAVDAGIILDNSQNGICYPNQLQGHPRGHASNPNAEGLMNSVENYSFTGQKTGFLSRDDQDFVGHLTLKNEYTQKAMDRLNDGSLTEAVYINSSELTKDDLPLANEYIRGVAKGKPQKIQRVTAVLRHFFGKEKNKEADVFVHTFFPRLT